jgi:hypothetical protein
VKKLTIKQVLLSLLAIMFYVASFIFDGAPASFCSIFIAVALTAYVIHTLPPIFKNEGNN